MKENINENKKGIIAVVAIFLLVLVAFFGFQTVTKKMAVKDGQAFLEQKEYEKAYTSFVKAEKKHGLGMGKTEIRYYEGECLMLLERFDEAAKVYDHIAEPRGIALKGFACQQNEEEDQAIDCYRLAIEKDPSDGIGYYYLYAYYMGKKDYVKALNTIEEAKSQKIDHMKQDIDFAYIVVFEKMLQYDQALEAAEDYVTRYPEDEKGQHELAFLETR